MRLIDAERLKDAIYTDFWEHFTQYHDSDQTALIDMVMDDIDETPTITPSGWVCVKDRLPNFGKLVIATDGTNYGIAWFCSDCTWMAKIGYKSQSWFGRKVTHWMPIPELPNIRPPEGEANGK